LNDLLCPHTKLLELTFHHCSATKMFHQIFHFPVSDSSTNWGLLMTIMTGASLKHLWGMHLVAHMMYIRRMLIVTCLCLWCVHPPFAGVPNQRLILPSFRLKVALKHILLHYCQRFSLLLHNQSVLYTLPIAVIPVLSVFLPSHWFVHIAQLTCLHLYGRQDSQMQVNSPCCCLSSTTLKGIWHCPPILDAT
jgi:hypothetical protein